MADFLKRLLVTRTLFSPGDVEPLIAFPFENVWHLPALFRRYCRCRRPIAFGLNRRRPERCIALALRCDVFL